MCLLSLVAAQPCIRAWCQDLTNAKTPMEECIAPGGMAGLLTVCPYSNGRAWHDKSHQPSQAGRAHVQHRQSVTASLLHHEHLHWPVHAESALHEPLPVWVPLSSRALLCQGKPLTLCALHRTNLAGSALRCSASKGDIWCRGLQLCCMRRHPH